MEDSDAEPDADVVQDGPYLLKQWRGDRSLLEVSRILGCDPSLLSLLETRKRKLAKLEFALKLKRITGIPVESWETVDDTAGGAA